MQNFYCDWPMYHPCWFLRCLFSSHVLQKPLFFFLFFFNLYPCIRYKIYRAKPKTFVLIKRSIVSILICGLRAFFKIKLKAHNHGFVESLIIIKNECRTEFETLGGPFHNLCCFFFWPWGHPCRNIKESYLLCSNLTRPSLLFSFT